MSKINTQLLRAALKLVAAAIPKNSHIPILEGVKIEGGRLVASNNEICVAVPLELNIKPCVLEYATLTAAVNKLDADEIELKQTATGVTLSSGRARVTVPAVGEAKDFPEMKATTGGHNCTLSAAEMQKVIGLIPFAAGPNDLRSGLRGICFNGAEFAATNGHVLAKYQIESGQPGAKIVLPIKLAYQLAAFASADAFAFEGSTVTVKKGDALMATVKFLCIDEGYPEYQNVIPDYRKLPNANFESEEMLQALEVLSIGANDATHKAIFEFSSAGSIKAIAADTERNRDAGVDIISDNRDFKEAVKIGLNNKLLINALKFIGGEETRAFVNGGNKPVIIISEATRGLALVMPIMI